MTMTFGSPAPAQVQQIASAPAQAAPPSNEPEGRDVIVIVPPHNTANIQTLDRNCYLILQNGKPVADDGTIKIKVQLRKGQMQATVGGYFIRTFNITTGEVVALHVRTDPGAISQDSNGDMLVEAMITVRTNEPLDVLREGCFAERIVVGGKAFVVANYKDGQRGYTAYIPAENAVHSSPKQEAPAVILAQRQERAAARDAAVAAGTAPAPKPRGKKAPAAPGAAPAGLPPLGAAPMASGGFGAAPVPTPAAQGGFPQGAAPAMPQANPGAFVTGQAAPQFPGFGAAS